MQLFLLRHAKAVQGGAGMADFDRPLAPRGKRAAELVGERMAEDGFVPDLILCSPSVRTRETLAEITQHIGGNAEVIFAPGLYDASSGDYLRAIADGGDNARKLLVIGHNPAIHRTALSLIGGGKRKLTDDIAKKFPTGALVVVEFKGKDWSRLATGSGKVKAFLKPRDLVPDGEDMPED